METAAFQHQPSTRSSGGRSGERCRRSTASWRPRRPEDAATEKESWLEGNGASPSSRGLHGYTAAHGPPPALVSATTHVLPPPSLLLPGGATLQPGSPRLGGRAQPGLSETGQPFLKHPIQSKCRPTAQKRPPRSPPKPALPQLVHCETGKTRLPCVRTWKRRARSAAGRGRQVRADRAGLAAKARGSLEAKQLMEAKRDGDGEGGR